MIDLVEGCAVEQEKILVVVATVHIQAAGKLYSLGHTAGALHGFHHVGRREQRKLGLNVLL